jgi:hypothetical protein
VTRTTDVITVGDGTLLVSVYWCGSLLTYAWVDEEDSHVVDRYPWGAATRAYANGREGLMHRLILGLAPGDRVGHHVNEDTFDNRRGNLLACLDALDHGSQPHPRRNLAAGGHPLPPHEREHLLEQVGLVDEARRLREYYRLPWRTADVAEAAA